MARVTVEDCLENVDNRFELVLAATQRVRQLIFKGLEPTVAWENDKPTVVALREIAEGNINPKQLEELERAREQELQAAQAGVSDSFMAGSVSMADPTDEDGGEAGSDSGVNAIVTPLEQDAAIGSASPAKPVRTLNSAPSLFEQVASQSGPIIKPPVTETPKKEGSQEKTADDKTSQSDSDDTGSSQEGDGEE